MRRSIIVILAMTLIISTTAYARQESMVLYALDGRSEVVPYDDVAAWQKVGWYTAPVTMMYALDGRQAVVVKSDVAAWQKAGWYTEPSVRMYASDGRSEVVAKTNVEAWKQVGWYDYIPTQTMYAADGRREKVPVWDVEAWRSVNWLTEKEYTALMQKDKAYPLFALESDFYVGNIRLGMSYAEFYELYGNQIISESKIEYSDPGVAFFTVKFKDAVVRFQSGYSLHDKNAFHIINFETKSSKWNFARGIKVGDSVGSVYSKVPSTRSYYVGYMFDSSLNVVDGYEDLNYGDYYDMWESEEGIHLYYGGYGCDYVGGHMFLAVENGYVTSVMLTCY